MAYRPAARAYPAERGYDKNWRRASENFRRGYPYCLGCMAIGQRTLAHLVDHIVPHRGNRVLFWDTSNWQSSCNWHHNSIKPILEAMFRAGKIPASELKLQSKTAIQLTRSKFKPAVGLDGFDRGS
jgi:5-methylcytosine-specific restriction enzyme A